MRISENRIRQIIRETVERALMEDVLGDDWREKDSRGIKNSALNNYEAFEDQKEENNFSGQGEPDTDPTNYYGHDAMIENPNNFM